MRVPLALALAFAVLAPQAVAQSAADALPEPVGGFEALVSGVAYPAAASAAGAEGTVVVQFVVDAEGAVEAAAVVERAHPALDEAALAAVRAARFVPARLGGRAVRAELALPFVFALEEPVVSAFRRVLPLRPTPLG